MCYSTTMTKKWMYALGQLGWSLASYAPANLLNVFYQPPQVDGVNPLFPLFISTALIGGVFTWLGILSATGRIFDAVTDPLVAGLSDRFQSKWGRRIPFLASSALPFALFSFLIFVPPVGQESPWNVVWLAVMLFLYYLAFTLYVTPYTALLSELGKTAKERLDLSTMISVTWALGFVIGGSTFIILDAVKVFFPSNLLAFQLIMAVYSLIAFLLMMLPVIAIQEDRDLGQREKGEPLLPALKRLWSNPDFRWFVASDLMYWMALTFIQIGISYYVITLLGLEKGWTSIFLYIMFFGSFALYVPVNVLAKKWGKKNLMMVAFGLDAVVFGMVMVLGYLPLPREVQGLLVILLYIVPLAIFSIMPNAMVADMSHASLKTSGFGNEGMFFGVRTLMMKFGIAAANLIFPSLIQLGASPQNDWGLRLSGLVALVICLLGLVFISRYDEHKILRDLE
jgi:GPH family glycoside/pentoside/hexuronide:cation symporter